MNVRTVTYFALALALVTVSVPLGDASPSEEAAAEACTLEDGAGEAVDCLTCGLHVHPKNAGGDAKDVVQNVVHVHPCPA